MEFLEWLYTNNYNNLNEWIEVINSGGDVYPRFRIPYQQWVDRYIDDISSVSEEEVKSLLRLLLQPFTRELDRDAYESIISVTRNTDFWEGLSNDHKKTYLSALNCENSKRIENGNDAWEGLTWILQYLPYKPYKAIRALNSYLEAELCAVPDDRIFGIEQCIEIIEAKYINVSTGLERYLFSLKPREFESLIGQLYKHLGYSTELTPATRDGGKDIIATINREDGKEKIYVECKLYKTTKLTKETIRALGYLIINDRVNRGVLFCTGYVTARMREEDPRIQIWTLEEIITLLNAHIGSDWYRRLNLLIANYR